MANIIDFDKEGHIVYKGLLSSDEIGDYNHVIDVLKSEFPIIEKELKEKYPDKKGTGWQYKYYLGKTIEQYLLKFEVTEDERRRFFDEIKILASEDDRKRYEGVNSKTRSFFEQCYIFSSIDVDIVKKMNWSEWCFLFDRTTAREDSRIYKWIGTVKGKINRRDFRAFCKALNLYLKNKDTSVFENEELFIIYDSLLEMSRYWVKEFGVFKKSHPNSLKCKKEEKWSKKFFQICFERKKQAKSLTITEKIYTEVFKEIILEE